MREVPGTGTVTCSAQCANNYTEAVLEINGGLQVVNFTCINGIWNGRIACRGEDRQGVESQTWRTPLPDPHLIIDLLDGVYYRPLPEMVGFGGAVQRAAMERLGPMRGEMAVPISNKVNRLLAEILARLNRLGRPDGTESSSCVNCYGNSVWLPVRNGVEAVSERHTLRYPIFPPGVYLDATIPKWALVGGVRASELIYNGTCNSCCPCCSDDRSSSSAYMCGNVPGAGNSLNNAYSHWAPDQPRPYAECVGLLESTMWVSMKCDLGFDGDASNSLLHTIVQYAPNADSIDVAIPACNLGGICECKKHILSNRKLPALTSNPTLIAQFDGFLSELKESTLLGAQIECKYGNLTSVPIITEPEHELKIGDNDVGFFLDLSNNDLTIIPRGYIHNNWRVGCIDLSSNFLTSAPVIRNQWLKKLDISANPITELPRGIFSGLPRLQVLHARHLKLAHILLAGVLFQPENKALIEVQMQHSGIVTVSPYAFNRSYLVRDGDRLFDCQSSTHTANVQYCTPNDTEHGPVRFYLEGETGDKRVQCYARVKLDRSSSVTTVFHPLLPVCTCESNGINRMVNVHHDSLGCLPAEATTPTMACLDGSPVDNGRTHKICDILPRAAMRRVADSIFTRLAFPNIDPMNLDDINSIFCKLCFNDTFSSMPSMCIFNLNGSGEPDPIILPNISIIPEFTAPCIRTALVPTLISTTVSSLTSTPVASTEEASSATSSTKTALLVTGIIFTLILATIVFIRSMRTWSRNRKNSTIRDELLELAREATRREFAVKFRRLVELEGPSRLAELDSSFAQLSVNIDDVVVGVKVGDGSFGPIHLAQLSHGQTVLVKLVETPVRSLMTQCLVEAKMTLLLEHPNIVSLIGVVDNALPMMYIIEYFPGGTLKQFLKRHRPSNGLISTFLDEKSLISIAAQIASACEFLELRKIVHRSLAADYVVVNEDGSIVKLANVGDARDIYQSSVYMPVNTNSSRTLKQLAIRHMAPETLRDDVYSTKTDVWAFGITCWEIWMLGQVPYGSLSASEISSEILSGRRLTLPTSNCSDHLRVLVGSMWELDPKRRPSFTGILASLRLQKANDFSSLFETQSRANQFIDSSSKIIPARQLSPGRKLPASTGFSRQIFTWTGSTSGKGTGLKIAVVLTPNGLDVAGCMRDLSTMNQLRGCEHLLLDVGICRLNDSELSTVLYTESLTDRVLSDELDIPKAARWQASLDVAQALEYLHANRVVLRFLSPASCHLVASFRVKVLVTGTTPAESAGIDNDSTLAPVEVTPWCAPETIAKQSLTLASNVHVVATIIWGIHSGEVPWDFSPDRAYEFQSLARSAGGLPPLNNSNLSHRLVEIIEACHRPAPEDRPSIQSVVTHLLEGEDGNGWELDPDQLECLRTLGSGNFGDVLLMLFSSNNDQQNPGNSGRSFVAAKLLHDQSDGADDFLAELNVMKELRHPHLVQLLGAVTKSTPLMLVLEYLPGGALDDWLVRNSSMLMPPIFPNIAHQIALGMGALATAGITHRDLAARNVLVGEAATVKVADFGLSRVLDEKDYYSMQSDGMVALRWTAPECFATGQWTTLSDVYSFGVLISELYSCGEPPFNALDDDALLNIIKQRTNVPLENHLAFARHGAEEHAHASNNAKAVAGECLARDPSSRPTFNDLATKFLILWRDAQKEKVSTKLDNDGYIEVDALRNADETARVNRSSSKDLPAPIQTRRSNRETAA